MLIWVCYGEFGEGDGRILTPPDVPLRLGRLTSERPAGQVIATFSSKLPLWYGRS